MKPETTEQHAFPGDGVWASALAAELGGVLHGPDARCTAVAPAASAGPGTLSFVEKPQPTDASVVLARDVLDGTPTIVVANPRAAFAAVLRAHMPDPAWPDDDAPLVSPDATVHPTARLGRGVRIHGGCRIGPRCTIGDHTVLFPNVVLYGRTVVGQHCRIHAGAVIGADGFSFVAGDQRPEKMPQLGRVRIGDRVEIGAGTCIDRGALGDTTIDNDVKIDNLVQIGHNVHIGQGSLLAAQVGIAGSAVIGPGCVLAGQVGVGDHVRIGAGAQVGGQAGVVGHLDPGARVWGTPAIPIGLAKRAAVLLRRLAARRSSGAR